MIILEKQNLLKGRSRPIFSTQLDQGWPWKKVGLSFPDIFAWPFDDGMICFVYVFDWRWFEKTWEIFRRISITYFHLISEQPFRYLTLWSHTILIKCNAWCVSCYLNAKCNHFEKNAFETCTKVYYTLYIMMYRVPIYLPLNLVDKDSYNFRWWWVISIVYWGALRFLSNSAFSDGFCRRSWTGHRNFPKLFNFQSE